MKVILPTADIVREAERYEPLLQFYDNGIKRIVETSVNIIGSYDDSFTRNEHFDCYVLDLVNKYNNSLYAINSYYRENTNASSYVEFAILSIIYMLECEVGTLLPRNKLVRLKNTIWFGNDLIVELERKHDPRHCYTRIKR